jgi:hypothetical protein
MLRNGSEKQRQKTKEGFRGRRIGDSKESA